MTERRPLGETVLDVVLGAAVASTPAPLLRSVSMKLPIEVSLRRTKEGWELLGDVPRTVTRTPFDTPPSRLEVVWVAR